MEQKLLEAASRLPEPNLDFQAIHPRTSRILPAIASIAACLVLLLSIGFVTVEAKEYQQAILFFNANDLSTDSLTREQIKAVYRDITTKSFTFDKTAQVIQRSLSVNRIEGYEILQENLTPEEVQNLWNFKNTYLQRNSNGLHYQYRSEYKEDPLLGFEVHDKSFLEYYDGETLLWSVSFTEFWIEDYAALPDGVITWGRTHTWSSEQESYAWMAMVDQAGNLLWKRQLAHGFEDEYISAVVENTDGSYAVFSRGDLRYLVLSQFTPDGAETGSRKTDIGNYGIWNAARLGDGYIVQLGSYMTNEHSKIVKVDHDGSITESFSYGQKDAYYHITDMIEYGGCIYLSAYATPKLADEEKNAGGRYEIADILNDIFDRQIWDISSAELTPMVANHYTAMLLICDPEGGVPREFFSVKGSLGGKLALRDTGELVWDVEQLVSTYFSPATSAFTIGGTCQIYRYSFGKSGILISQERTNEFTPYHR